MRIQLVLIDENKRHKYFSLFLRAFVICTLCASPALAQQKPLETAEPTLKSAELEAKKPAQINSTTTVKQSPGVAPKQPSRPMVPQSPSKESIPNLKAPAIPRRVGEQAPVKPGPVKPAPVKPMPIKPQPTRPQPIQPQPTKPSLIKPIPIAPRPGLSPVQPKPGLTTPGAVSSENLIINITTPQNLTMRGLGASATTDWLPINIRVPSGLTMRGLGDNSAREYPPINITVTTPLTMRGLGE